MVSTLISRSRLVFSMETKKCKSEGERLYINGKCTLFGKHKQKHTEPLKERREAVGNSKFQSQIINPRAGSEKGLKGPPNKMIELTIPRLQLRSFDPLSQNLVSTIAGRSAGEAASLSLACHAVKYELLAPSRLLDVGRSICYVTQCRWFHAFTLCDCSSSTFAM